jgi:hypothetical protein
MKAHPLHRDAQRIARPPDPQMETPGTVDAARGFDGDEQVDALNSDTATRQRKRFESLRAEAALAGFELHDHGDGKPLRYSATQWGHTRELGSLEAVAAWLVRSTGKAVSA